MTAKEYLSQYRRASERVRQAKIELKRLEDLRDAMDIDYSGMPKGTQTSDRVGSLAVKIADAHATYAARLDDAEAVREEVASAIDAMRDPIKSRVLYDRYILCMTWQEVADDIGYDVSHVATRMHGRALQEIRIP